MNGGKSSWVEVLSGIPQGSVLGPILFLHFIDDLPDSIEDLVKIFADDTKVFTAVHEDADWKRLQKDLDNLSDWSDRWQLRFNVGKCGVMHYDNQQIHLQDARRGSGERSSGNKGRERPWSDLRPYNDVQ